MKLFFILVVLHFMDHSLLPEGSGTKISSDSEDETQTSFETKEQTTVGGEKSRNFLLESVSASSTSSSESEQEEEQEESSEAACHGCTGLPLETLLPPAYSASSHKLPPPPLEGSGSGGLPACSSVFANPFKERAEERLNVLQKHVPLTLQARPSQIDGKRMCVAYRKDGRCRFGIRCKFAHDSDLQSSTSGHPTEPACSENGPTDQSELNAASSRTSDSRSSGLEKEEEEEENRKRKKHRVGLSDTLIPPKRALKQYSMQRDNISQS